eukprot:scaffold38067_cov73-Phaeocystis_antarctica.AAC.1
MLLAGLPRVLRRVRASQAPCTGRGKWSTRRGLRVRRWGRGRGGGGRSPAGTARSTKRKCQRRL